MTLPPDMMAMRVAIESASSWSWVTKTNVVPDLAVDPGQLGLHLLAELEVERAERLVEQQHRRSLGERPGQRDPLLLPAGQLRTGSRSAKPAEPDEVEVLADAPADLVAGRGFSIRSPKATFWATVMCGNRA